MGHPGSGYNYLCMHPQPQWPSGMNAGNQDGALLYGVEYENTGAVDKNYQKDAACVVCEHKRSTGVPYVQWGRKSCSNGHKLEYYGLIMADRYTHQKSEYICVDWERAAHKRSSNSNHNGGLLYTTEMQTAGHSSGDEQQYGHDRELSCAVCSSTQKILCADIPNCATLPTCSTFSNQQCKKCTAGFYLKHGTKDSCVPCPSGKYCDGTTSVQSNSGGKRAVFTRWGSRSCPSGTTKLYEGFIANDYYTHRGSGANYLCMHPQPQWPSGMSTGNQDGALLYGVEYENTGAIDKNHNKDAGCVVCEHKRNTGVPYVQWGRKSCSNGHKTEYHGVVMADHYSHKKSEYICVDWERAAHARSENADHNGGLLYTTEMQTNGHSSGDEMQYGHDREVSCVVCS